jgi:hypothetical protein
VLERFNQLVKLNVFVEHIRFLVLHMRVRFIGLLKRLELIRIVKVDEFNKIIKFFKIIEHIILEINLDIVVSIDKEEEEAVDAASNRAN